MPLAHNPQIKLDTEGTGTEKTHGTNYEPVNRWKLPAFTLKYGNLYVNCRFDEDEEDPLPCPVGFAKLPDLKFKPTRAQMRQEAEQRNADLEQKMP